MRRWRAGRSSRDTGSVLLLVPAGLLVLLVLGAIAVDSAVVFLAERDLSNRTAAVANDVAAASTDDAAFYLHGGEVRLDPEAVSAYTAGVFGPARLPGGYDGWSATAEVDGARVTVTAQAQVHLVFAPAIPGVRRRASVRARAVATARGG